MQRRIGVEPRYPQQTVQNLRSPQLCYNDEGKWKRIDAMQDLAAIVASRPTVMRSNRFSRCALEGL